MISVGILLIYLSKRYDADCLLKNVFEIFENPLGGGRVSPNEILWIFSMAMNGTGKDEFFSDKHDHHPHHAAEEKLQWLFKLYDKDMNGEIVQEELEDIFIKMCKIVEKTELDHIKKHAKIAEEERKRKSLGTFSMIFFFGNFLSQIIQLWRSRERRRCGRRKMR